MQCLSNLSNRRLSNRCQPFRHRSICRTCSRFSRPIRLPFPCMSRLRKHMNRTVLSNKPDQSSCSGCCRNFRNHTPLLSDSCRDCLFLCSLHHRRFHRKPCPDSRCRNNRNFRSANRRHSIRWHLLHKVWSFRYQRHRHWSRSLLSPQRHTLYLCCRRRIYTSPCSQAGRMYSLFR